MSKKASFKFYFDLSSEAEIIARSLSPELKQKIPHTNVKISVLDKAVLLDIVFSKVSKSTAVSANHIPSGFRLNRCSKSLIPQIIWVRLSLAFARGMII